MDKLTNIQEQYDKIYRYCFFRLRSREQAEDITQETFLRFLESAGYQSRGRELQYLYTIARNLCIDLYRSRQEREIAMADPAEGESYGVFSREGAREACGTEEEWLEVLGVRSALARLAAQEQEILLLRYANDLPIGDIGGLLGLSRFAVYRRIRAALARLQRELEKEGLTGKGETR